MLFEALLRPPSTMSQTFRAPAVTYHEDTLHSLRSEAYKETYMDVECLLTACNKQIVAAVEDLPMKD